MNNTPMTNSTAVEQIAEGYCPYLPFVFAFVVLIFQAIVLWLTVLYLVSLCIVWGLVAYGLTKAPEAFRTTAAAIPVFGAKIVQLWEAAE